MSERRHSEEAREINPTQANTPKPEAAVGNDRDKNSLGMIEKRQPEDPEHTLIAPSEERSEQQRVSHRASVNSRTQDSERMAGAFPDEDNESVYSSATTDDQNANNFQAPVEEKALQGSERMTDSHGEAPNDSHYRSFQETTEESGQQVSSPSAAENSSEQLSQPNGRSHPKPSSNEQEHEDSFEKPAHFRSSQTFPARPGKVSDHPSTRSYSTDLSLRRARTAQPVHLTKEAAVTELYNATDREPGPSSDASAVPVATGPLIGVEQTKERSQADSTLAAREDNEEDRTATEAKDADPRNSTVGPLKDNQEAWPQGKQDELQSTGTDEAIVDVVAVAESDTPSDRTAHAGSKTEPAEVIQRVSIPDEQLLRQPSIQKRTSSKVAKKVTLPTPKIFVQSPSEATDQDITEPSPTPEAQPIPNDEYRIISRHGSVVSVQHTVNSATEKLKQPRVRRRKLYLHKARNLAARPIFLNATLGRRVGCQTKERLRRLAKGENVEASSIRTQANPPDTPRLRKSQSFIRKARNLVARKSFMDMAFGREISSDTKPVLRQMASGQFRIVEDGQNTEVTA